MPAPNHIQDLRIFDLILAKEVANLQLSPLSKKEGKLKDLLGSFLLDICIL